MEYALIKHINKYFRQVYSTLVVSNQTRMGLGEMATSEQADRILESTYNFEGKMAPMSKNT